MPSPTAALNRAYADSAEAQMARLMATAREAEATREEAVAELETVTAALVEERRRYDAAKAELAETRRALRKTRGAKEEPGRPSDSSDDSEARTARPESTARAPRLGPSPAVAPENASVKTKAMWFQKRHAPDLAGEVESDDGSGGSEPRATPPRRRGRSAPRRGAEPLDVAVTAAAAAATAARPGERALRARVADLESRGAGGGGGADRQSPSRALPRASAPRATRWSWLTTRCRTAWTSSR